MIAIGIYLAIIIDFSVILYKKLPTDFSVILYKKLPTSAIFVVFSPYSLKTSASMYHWNNFSNAANNKRSCSPSGKNDQSFVGLFSHLFFLLLFGFELYMFLWRLVTKDSQTSYHSLYFAIFFMKESVL